MDAAQVRRATTAALLIAAARNLSADDAIVLNNSNKLVLRLLPSDVVARVAPGATAPAQFEVDLAQRLAEANGPVAELDPRVEPRAYEHDGYAVTFWTCYPAMADGLIAPDDYADALERLHAAIRNVDVSAPHFTDRVAEARELISSSERTPALADEDRVLLGSTLRATTNAILERGAVEQLLHGEPHPGNVLATKDGPRFIDLETCCRGPIEFDLAHVPEAVAERYPGLDDGLLRQCRLLVLAMIATWRWDRDDQFPNGHQLGIEWIGQLRATLENA